MTAADDDVLVGSPDDPEGRPASRVTAVSVRGRPVRRTPLAWLPWAALALAAVLALAMVLIAIASAT